jgi:hypothetical protein
MGDITITQTLERRSIELNEESIHNIVVTHLAKLWCVPKNEIRGSLHTVAGFMCAGSFSHEKVSSE